MTAPAIERESTLELGLVDYVSDLGYAIVRPDVDLQKLVKDNGGAVIRVRRSGGEQQPWQLVARIVVEVYAASYTKVWEVAEAVAGQDGRLQASPYRAGGWVVDRAESESANTELAHPNLRVVSAVLRVTTRSGHHRPPGPASIVYGAGLYGADRYT